MHRAGSGRSTDPPLSGSSSSTVYTYTLETIIQARVSQHSGYFGSRRRQSADAQEPNSCGSDAALHHAIRGDDLPNRCPLSSISRVPPSRRHCCSYRGAALFLRFLYQYASGDGSGHVQSLVIGATLIASAAILFVGGIIADLIAANRTLLTEIPRAAAQRTDRSASSRNG